MRRKRNTLKAYTIASIILLAGSMISIQLNDWSWFSRCGSLVVVIGIILTSSQILDHIQLLKLRELNLSGDLNRDWASEERKQSLLESRFSEETTWSNERSGFLMLIAGTLIWGFGDLVGILF